ncbi:MAG: hypothetical protein EGQ35_05555 [Clostridiales bacterium]|nr:hypothetical protein [Clostridiales bacterium]
MKLRALSIITVTIIMISGCGSNKTEAEPKKIEFKSADEFEKENKSIDSDNSDTDNVTQNTYSETEVDYDLTKMNADMIYAMVFQMVIEPEQYEGKTFRIEGFYYSRYSDVTNKKYHYCLVRDAAACCAQGLEFVLDDEKNSYPKEEENMIVEGTFETYMEANDKNVYSRLKDAKIEILPD